MFLEARIPFAIVEIQEIYDNVVYFSVAKPISYEKPPYFEVTVKESMKTKYSADKIYYNFSQENPKIKTI